VSGAKFSGEILHFVQDDTSFFVILSPSARLRINFAKNLSELIFGALRHAQGERKKNVVW